MATKAASKRLGKEAQMMDRDPPPYCYGRPREDNVLEWHFILRGPPDTPFHGGEYWGQLLFPPEYPFKPPGIKMSTPSGRFHTDTKICTSMSDFHPGSWNPAWSVANILVGLLSFMCSDEMTTGSVMATHADRCTLAQRSHAFNISQPRFKRIFPDYCDLQIRSLPNMGDKKSDGESSKDGENAIPTANKGAEFKPIGTSASAERLNNGISTATSSTLVARHTNRAHTIVQPTANNLAQAPNGPQRSRAIFPFLLALAAYLFISRFASIMGGSGNGSTGSA